MTALHVNLNPDHWRLSIDSSKLSLKVVLIHYGKSFLLIPVGYFVHMKETWKYEITLRAIRYDDFQWWIGADLKVIAILLRM